jgi:hypothetical protein
MCCQIATLIFGILALVNGEFKLTRTRVVGGTPARIIGGILLLPLPMTFGLAVLLGLALAMRGDTIDEKQIQAAGNVLSVGVLVFCLILAIGIAIFTAKPVKPPNPFTFDRDFDGERRPEIEPPDDFEPRPPDSRGPDSDPPGPSSPDPRFRTR